MRDVNTYLFYDIETTGLSHAFDQVLQFAAIRTDETFHEIERHEVIVKLRPDVIPSPTAMIAHGIPLSRSMTGICEFEAIEKIHELLNTPNTTSLGYNTLGFDDEFLRFCFYRNLLPPYTHQYANNCGRMDLLPMVTMYWLYKNDILEWPEQEGKISLKLEDLSNANQLMEGTAHDALADVEACVALARRLSQEKEMWKYLADYFHKENDMSRIKKLPRLSRNLASSYRLGLLISKDYGSKQNYQVPVISIGDSVLYTNQSLWLRIDLPSLRSTTPDSIPENTWIIRKKYGQLGIILPPLDRFLARIDQERLQVIEENKQWLKDNAELLEKISSYYREFAYPDLPEADADALLYQSGFLSYRDEELCRRFHSVSLAEKVGMCQNFESEVVQELAKRVIFRNYSKQIPEALKRQSAEYKRKVNPRSPEEAIVDYRGERRTTPASTLEEIKKLRQEEELNPTQRKSIAELENYILEKFPKREQLSLL